jgi:hypothetical protein
MILSLTISLAVIRRVGKAWVQPVASIRKPAPNPKP